jgi:hypothetical protein
MYSYEDRLRAVQLYIKLGKRVGLTIRQLGYPTKNALKAWHREYELRHDLAAVYVRRPKYSQAQKAHPSGRYKVAMNRISHDSPEAGAPNGFVRFVIAASDNLAPVAAQTRLAASWFSPQAGLDFSGRCKRVHRRDA